MFKLIYNQVIASNLSVLLIAGASFIILIFITVSLKNMTWEWIIGRFLKAGKLIDRFDIIEWAGEDYVILSFDPTKLILIPRYCFGHNSDKKRKVVALHYSVLMGAGIIKTGNWLQGG